MEKDVALGSVGDLDLALSGGKASVVVKLNVPEIALSINTAVVMDAGVLIDKLEAAIEAKYPGAAPVEKAIFGLLKQVVTAV